MPRASLGSCRTRYPARVTDAGLVPWAESGMKIVPGVRPCDSWYARMMRSPVSSPAAPAGGWKVARAMPVRRAEDVLGLEDHLEGACERSAGVAGCRSRKAGCSAAQSHTLGLYFMVQEPSG